ncbi:MAG: phosphatase PAP2 family protein [Actinomycetota bacterium]|nr:phosphatase PAP2 family protein [Actinomycetota bacterium]
MDTRLFRDINNLARHTAWLHGFMRAYAIDGGIFVMIAILVAAWFLARRDPDWVHKVSIAVWTGAGTLVALAVNQPLTHLFGRERPFVALPHVDQLVQHGKDFGFPSDHGTLVGAVVAGLWIGRFRILAIVAAVFGLVLMFGRVYLGLHYPGDLVAGAALGSLIVILLRPLAMRLLVPVVAWTGRGVLAPVVRKGAWGVRPTVPEAQGPQSARPA